MKDLRGKLISLSFRVDSSCLCIYDAIRGVGYGEFTADNALHRLIEQCHDLNRISEDIKNLANLIEKEEGAE